MKGHAFQRSGDKECHAFLSHSQLPPPASSSTSSHAQVEGTPGIPDVREKNKFKTAMALAHCGIKKKKLLTFFKNVTVEGNFSSNIGKNVRSCDKYFCDIYELLLTSIAIPEGLYIEICKS